MSCLYACRFPYQVSFDERNLDDIAERIVASFEEDDIAPIESLLSQSALETDDLMEGIHYAHELLEPYEEIQVTDGGHSEGDLFLRGGRANWYDYYYDVEADGDKFCLRFQYFTFNDIYPTDKGLFRVYFASEEQTEWEGDRFKKHQGGPFYPLHWNYGARYERAGIYNPEWIITPSPNGDTSQRY